MSSVGWPNIAVSDPVTSVGISAQTTVGIAVENAHKNSRASHWQAFAQTPGGHSWSWKGVTRERASYISVPEVGAEADAIAYQVQLSSEGTDVGVDLSAGEARRRNHRPPSRAT